jgi:6-pyruvoyl-tetrahydropterin synthase
MKLECRYEAQAAHQLSAGVPEGHPCRRLHGHRYNITVAISGDVDPATGMLLEYADIDRRVHEVLRFVDHNFINNLGEDTHVTTDPTTPFEIVVRAPILGVTLREEKLAAKVRENSTVEYLADWFIAELAHRFPRQRRKVGPLTLVEPYVFSVRIEEDSGHVVERYAGEAS